MFRSQEGAAGWGWAGPREREWGQGMRQPGPGQRIMNKEHHSETPSLAGHAGGEAGWGWQATAAIRVVPVLPSQPVLIELARNQPPGQASKATERQCGKGSQELSFCTLKLPVAPELRRWLVAAQANGKAVSRAPVPLEFQACCRGPVQHSFQQ